MIKIAKKELYKGLNLSQNFYNCRNSHNCLWRRRTDLFNGFLPRGCPRENCPVVIFRKKLEGDSPCYYAEVLRRSQWWCVSSLATIDKRRKTERRELERRVYDLDIYGRLVILTIHPLALTAQRIPFLKPQEIETLQKSWSPEERNHTEQTIYEINPNWFGWLESFTRKIAVDQTYHEAVLYLVYLFLKGFDQQLPDLDTDKEKAKFFSEIEKCLRA